MGERTHIDLVIPGEPPRKNDRYKIVVITTKTGKKRGALKNSDSFKLFVMVLMSTWRTRGLPKIQSGAWRLTVAAFWSRLAHERKGKKLDRSFAIGDVDAPTSWVLDALEECGALDDDVRVVEETSFKAYDKHNPRTVITLERVEDAS